MLTYGGWPGGRSGTEMNCYILTGGRSSRMGRSKADLFLGRVLAAARPVFDELIAVERHAGQTRQELRTIFEEPHEHEAPVFGVLRALQDATGPCFILAVDYPRVTADVLRFVRDEARVPVWNGRPQMLCSVWDPAMLPDIRRRVASGRLDLHDLHGTAMIEEAVLRARFAGEPLKNVNTPAELEEAGEPNGRQ